jgi:hypothetical protein
MATTGGHESLVPPRGRGTVDEASGRRYERLRDLECERTPENPFRATQRVDPAAERADGPDVRDRSPGLQESSTGRDSGARGPLSVLSNALGPFCDVVPDA